MIIATWNLNNRVGNRQFHPDTANAAIALDADVLVFNEYYPKEQGVKFCRLLYEAGWSYQEESKDAGKKANRVLIASRFPIQPLNICLPDFDRQFPSNVLCVSVPSIDISIVGVRVPWYVKQDAGLIFKAWEWLESIAISLKDRPSIILGDLNVGLELNPSRGRDYFLRILESGWHRAIPEAMLAFLVMASSGLKSIISWEQTRVNLAMRGMSRNLMVISLPVKKMQFLTMRHY